MKLFCINTDGWSENNRKFLWIKLLDKDCDGPKYGDIVTVKSTYYSKGKKYHNLVEWPPNDGDNGYQADCFIPITPQYEKISLSQIQETASVN